MGNTTKNILKEYFATGPEYTFFGNLKARKRTYKDEVMIATLQILFDLNQIGEKSFDQLDKGKETFQAWVNDHADDFDAVVTKFESANERKEFCAEFCYSKFFKNNNILSTSPLY